MKNRLATFAFIIFLVILSACTRTERPLSAVELIDLGEKYLLEMDYEQALVQFLKVIEVEPMNSRGYTGAAEAYVGLGQPEMAIDILEQGQMTLGENENVRSMLDEIHRAEEARQKAEIEAEEARRQAEIEANMEFEIKQELDEILSMFESNGFDSILEFIESGAYKEMLTEIKDFPLILLNEAGDYGIGIYEGEFLYIGRYVDGQRSGHALWVRSLGDRYEGEWANDLPNGGGVVHMNNPEHWNISGTLENGLWNGPVTEVVGGGNIFIVEFVNGKAVTTGEPHEADGVNRWPVSYKEERPDWFWEVEKINGLHGVFPFAEYSY